MGYPDMSTEVFQNANISMLACQLFVMLVSLAVVIVINKKGATNPGSAAKI